MNQQQKNSLAFIVGGVGALAIFLLHERKARAKHKAVMADLEEDRKAVWVAAGIVKERSRRGYYWNKHPHDLKAQLEEANMDFDFERIRFRNEEIQP